MYAMMQLRVALTIVMSIALAAPATESFAQRRRREVKWINADIPKMKGLRHKTLNSKAMKREVGYVVWTPPGFQKNGKRRYPVIYFLHGAGGSEKSDSAGFSSKVSKAIREEQLPAVICVFPNGGMSGYRGEVETMIMEELIPQIDRSYPTLAKASGRVVCGFSMGGAGAVHLSPRHAESFCAAGSWGGALSFRGRAEESPLLDTAKQNADKLKSNHFGLLTVNGDQDRPDAFQPLHAIFREADIAAASVTLKDTKHNLGKYYELAGDTMIQFLAKQLEQANQGNDSQARATETR